MHVSHLECGTGIDLASVRDGFVFPILRFVSGYGFRHTLKF
jgi:hypothetical protein